MTWSLQTSEMPDSPLFRAAFTAAGRALYLSHHFCAKCTRVLAAGGLEDWIDPQKRTTLDAVLAHAAQRLGNAGSQWTMGKLGGVGWTDIEFVKLARLAVLAITERGALFPRPGTRNDERLVIMVGHLRQSVRDLVRGDAIVSRWLHAVEPSPGETPWGNGYAAAAEAWVFGDYDAVGTVGAAPAHRRQPSIG